MSIEKPLTQFMRDYYDEEFSDVVKDAIESKDEMYSEDMKLLISKAYYEGFLDGAKVIFAAIEF